MAAKAIHPANTKPTYGKAITHSIINPINKARRNKEPVIWGGGGIKLLLQSSININEIDKQSSPQPINIGVTRPALSNSNAA